MKKRLKALIAFLMVVLISVSTGAGRVYAEENVTERNGYYGALQVEGTHLVAADGRTVQLKGVSTHGLGWFPEYVNADLISQIRQEWGCNVFRLAMYTAEYNGYCTSDDNQKNNLKNIIDTGVKAAVEQDMYVIIDWHVLNDRNPNTYKEEAKKFFAEMAQKYANIPNVIYEICNEPNGGVSWSEIKSYALEVIPVIRQFAPNAVIIVGTPTWSQDVDIVANDPITEYNNIMYALHFYADTHRDNYRAKCTAAVEKGLPVFVSEYGTCDASGGGANNFAEADKWIELLDGYGISHVVWNLSNKAETCALIKSSCNNKNHVAESELSEAGKWFVNMVKAGEEELPTPTATPTPEATPSPVVTPIVTPQPSATPTEAPVVTVTPQPSATPTEAPVVTVTPQPTQAPQNTPIPQPTIPAPVVYEGNGYKITYKVDSAWADGYIGNVTIENTGTQVIEDWCLTYSSTGVISNLWNGKIVSNENGTYVVKHADWNQDIQVGQSVQFGFQAGGDVANGPSGFALSDKVLSPATQAYTAEYIQCSDWGSGFNSAILITNNSDTVIEDWTLEMTFERQITEIWNAKISSQQGNKYTIDNAGYNSIIYPGQTVHIGFNGNGGVAGTAATGFDLFSAN